MRVHDEVSSTDDLVTYLRSTNREGSLYIGIELERSAAYRDTLDPVHYHGDNGFHAVFNKLVEEAGWEILEQEQDEIYELQRGDTRITIEGNGRPELSGSPKEHLHDLSREFRLHENELKEMGSIFNIGWLTLGLDPIAANEQLPMVKKDRYQIIMDVGEQKQATESYLKRVNGLTVNFSYTNEENAIRKAQTAFRILPIIGAMFASSPFEKGELTSTLDLRRSIIKSFHPQRTGVPPTILDDHFGFEEWIEYYLDIPVILIQQKEGADLRPEATLTFRQWMEQGYAGRRPTPADFDQHVKTVWSDIRLRPSYLEYRVPDSVPSRFAMSLPALIKGLVFDSANWAAVEDLTKGWTYDDILEIDRRSWDEGLQTKVQGKTLLSYAQELLLLANETLHGFERTDSTDTDESVYLTQLKEQIYIKEQSFAEELRDMWHKEWNGDMSRLIEWCVQEA